MTTRTAPSTANTGRDTAHGGGVKISRCDGCGRVAPRVAHRLGTACEMCGHLYLVSADRRRNPQRPWTTWIEATAPRD